MKKFIFRSFPILSLCLALITCRNEPEPSPCDCGEVTTIDELREWAFFKEGTYWIYEEETTLARDTFTVVNSHDFITTDGFVQFDYETYRSSDGYNYWFWFNEGWSADDCKEGCCTCRRLWCDRYTSGDADGESPLFTFPNFIGNYSYITAGLEVGIVEITNTLDSFCIATECFDSVVLSHNSLSVLDQDPSSNAYYSANYYFCRSKGIIRKEISQTSQIWNLIEYHIVQ